MITFNGNEMLMQNDMGNATIKDDDGNAVSLPEGYIPVGIKEHGGVLYIASVTKDGKSELGSFPSPEIKMSAISKDEGNDYSIKIPWGTEIALGGDEIDVLARLKELAPSDPKNITTFLNDNSDWYHNIVTDQKLSDSIVKFGDIFGIQAAFINDKGNAINSSNMSYDYFEDGNGYPMVSRINESFENLKDGVFNVNLKSKIRNGEMADVALSAMPDKDSGNRGWWYTVKNGIYETTTEDIDLENLSSDFENFHKYPNIPRGTLYAGVEVNLPKNVVFITSPIRMADNEITIGDGNNITFQRDKTKLTLQANKVGDNYHLIIDGFYCDKYIGGLPITEIQLVKQDEDQYIIKGTSTISDFTYLKDYIVEDISNTNDLSAVGIRESIMSDFTSIDKDVRVKEDKTNISTDIQEGIPGASDEFHGELPLLLAQNTSTEADEEEEEITIKDLLDDNTHTYKCSNNYIEVLIPTNLDDLTIELTFVCYHKSIPLGIVKQKFNPIFEFGDSTLTPQDYRNQMYDALNPSDNLYDELETNVKLKDEFSEKALEKELYVHNAVLEYTAGNTKFSALAPGAVYIDGDNVSEIISPGNITGDECKFYSQNDFGDNKSNIIRKLDKFIISSAPLGMNDLELLISKLNLVDSNQWADNLDILTDFISHNNEYDWNKLYNNNSDLGSKKELIGTLLTFVADIGILDHTKIRPTTTVDINVEDCDRNTHDKFGDFDRFRNRVFVNNGSSLCYNENQRSINNGITTLSRLGNIDKEVIYNDEIKNALHYTCPKKLFSINILDNDSSEILYKFNSISYLWPEVIENPYCLDIKQLYPSQSFILCSPSSNYYTNFKVSSELSWTRKNIENWHKDISPTLNNAMLDLNYPESGIIGLYYSSGIKYDRTSSSDQVQIWAGIFSSPYFSLTINAPANPYSDYRLPMQFVWESQEGLTDHNNKLPTMDYDNGWESVGVEEYIKEDDEGNRGYLNGTTSTVDIKYYTKLQLNPIGNISKGRYYININGDISNGYTLYYMENDQREYIDIHEVDDYKQVYNRGNILTGKTLYFESSGPIRNVGIYPLLDGYEQPIFEEAICYGETLSDGTNITCGTKTYSINHFPDSPRIRRYGIYRHKSLDRNDIQVSTLDGDNQVLKTQIKNLLPEYE